MDMGLWIRKIFPVPDPKLWCKQTETLVGKGSLDRKESQDCIRYLMITFILG